MQTIIIKDTEKIDTLMAIMKALKIKFTIKKNDESIYNTAFVNKINTNKKEMKNGNGKQYTIEQLKALCK